VRVADVARPENAESKRHGGILDYGLPTTDRGPIIAIQGVA
jgi:hypothetical protein